MSLHTQAKQEIIKNFQQSTTDTGSCEVQVAILTTRIEQLTGHLKSNNKDFSTKRGLVKMVSQRKKLLSYLKSTDLARYQALIGRLGLKK